MTNAHILTIGTEITSGEIVNSNAAWLSTQLEDLGVRVHSHLTVRDQREEMLAAFRWPNSKFIFITGGLGPTSDDLTRALTAEHLGVKLEFDEQVWSALNEMYAKRGLPVREAHRHQCWFPAGSERLRNPTGTALGFYSVKDEVHYFVLPGPPRELESMFKEEVLPRMRKLVPKSDLLWHRWNIFAVPESEVAEIVEPLIKDSGLEVGYRAQVPYVRLKLYAHPQKHREAMNAISKALAPSLVGEGAFVGRGEDLAEQLLKSWPDAKLKVLDEVSEGLLVQRLFAARRILSEQEPNRKLPELQIHAGGLTLSPVGDQFKVSSENTHATKSETRPLQFKTPLNTERGRKSAAEWALWLAVQWLK